MPRSTPVSCLLLLAGTALCVPAPALAQDGPLRARLDVVLTAAAGTPDQAGLLPTALAEAHVAAREARRAAAATDDLAAMQRHARGVIHAVDPTRLAPGAGQGYGVRRAVAEIAEHVQAGAAADPARDVAIAAPRALAAAQQVLAWADALVAVAEAVGGATSAAEAARFVPDLPPLARQMTRGVDRDGDERITFAPGEAGLIGLRLALGTLVAHRDALAAAGTEVPR